MRALHGVRRPLRKSLISLQNALERPKPAKSETKTKIAVGIAAFLIGAAIFISVIYGIIPSLLSDMSDTLVAEDAKGLYHRTVREARHTPPPDTAVFEQPAAARFPRDSFVAVRKDNSDIVGRVSSEGMQMAYLVVQASDNDYYLSHGYDRKESDSGAIYLDYRCNADIAPLKGHYILYGHNMKNGTMFHPLRKYKDEMFFEENRLIRFDTVYEDHNWEVFSVYVTGTDFYYIDTSFKDDAEWLTFLQEIQQKSLFQTDITLSADDVVLTLSTCDYSFDDARLVVHARLVK